jgi:hypothetical protein
MKAIVIFYLLFFTVFFTACSSGNSNQPTDVGEKNTATVEVQKSVKTSKHIKIPNSNLYIIPPSGFAASEISGTITNEEGHPSVLVMKIVVGTTLATFFEQLKTQSDKDFPGSWKEEDVLIGEHKSKIYQAKTAAGSQYYLAFTDGYTDEMIIVNYDEKDIATSKLLFEALKTAVVEK